MTKTRIKKIRLVATLVSSADRQNRSTKRSRSYQERFKNQPMRKQIIAVAVALFISSVFVLCATDTPETRHHEADRYLQAVPPKALFEDMADKMATNLPADQRQQFEQMMTKDLDIAAFKQSDDRRNGKTFHD
jgi:hypothetical protein